MRVLVCVSERIFARSCVCICVSVPVCVVYCIFNVIDIPHPGKCPSVPASADDICQRECRHDAHCPNDQKCCPTGCGTSCKKTVPQTGNEYYHEIYSKYFWFQFVLTIYIDQLLINSTRPATCKSVVFEHNWYQQISLFTSSLSSHHSHLHVFIHVRCDRKVHYVFTV